MYLLTLSQGYALLISGSKGQGHGALVIDNGFRTITDSAIHLWSWNFIHLLPLSRGCALLISGPKGQGHGLIVIENGVRTITDSVIRLWSWNFIHLLPMSQGCVLLILRSRSWETDDWKQFPDYDWLYNLPMIMKLHTPAPFESRSCGDRVVKLLACGARGPGLDSRPLHLNFQRLVISCLQVAIWLKYRWNRRKSSIQPTNKRYESRMCLIDFGVKGLGLLGIESSMFIQSVFASLRMMHSLLFFFAKAMRTFMRTNVRPY